MHSPYSLLRTKRSTLERSAPQDKNNNKPKIFGVLSAEKGAFVPTAINSFQSSIASRGPGFFLFKARPRVKGS